MMRKRNSGRSSCRLLFFPLLLAVLLPFEPGAQTTFTNPAPITITDGNASPVAATTYPTQIHVNGMSGTISSMKVSLHGFSHTFPDVVDILLVSPGRSSITLWSDAGGADDVSNLNITLFDSAAAPLPDNSALSSQTFRPANWGSSADTWPAPAPTPSSQSRLSAFNGTSPNGLWELYIVSDATGSYGSVSGGWSISFITLPVLPVTFRKTEIRAVPEKKEIRVSWSTTRDEPNHRFFVERSPDGQQWTTVGERAGSAAGSHLFRDTLPLRGSNLYRLRFLTAQGSYAYSKVLQASLKEGGAFQVYPNPARGFVRVALQNRNAGNVVVQLTDGQNGVRRQASGSASPTGPLQLDLQGLPPGHYFLKISTGKESSLEKIMVLP